MADTPPSARFPIEEIAVTPGPGLRVPNSFSFSQDDRQVTYLLAAGENAAQQLYALDTTTGQSSVLVAPPGGGVKEEHLTPEEELRRQRERNLATGLTHYSRAKHAERLLIPVRGDIYVKDGPEGALRLLVENAGKPPALSPALSPDGEWIAYVQDAEVYVVPAAGGAGAREVRAVGENAEAQPRNGSAAEGADTAEGEGALPPLQVGLLGAHQLTNAALAVATLRAAGPRLARPIPLEAYERGLRQAWLPGRLEIVQREPLVLLDAAHNAQKARALRESLDALTPGQPRVLVLGILADKASEEMIDVLAPGAQAVVVTRPPVIGSKHPESLERLAALARQFTDRVLAEPDPRRAVELALAETPAAGVLCVTGSLYLIGAVRGRWFPEDMLLAQAAEA